MSHIFQTSKHFVALIRNIKQIVTKVIKINLKINRQ